MTKILVIHIRCAKDILSLSAQEQFPDEQRPIEYIEDRLIFFNDINENCSNLFNYLNYAGKQANIDRTIFEHVKYIGQSLCDQLLTIKIKELIKNTKCRSIILKIDGSLVQVPWELLHIGGHFLCQRFSIGRMVSTRQNMADHITRKYQMPLKMLILADPKGDLDAAFDEGMIIKEKFKGIHKEVIIEIKTTAIKTSFIRKSLREYDMIHYAGHAEYHLKDPSKSGWQTVDGVFSTSDIINMRGGDPLPHLIFSNACQSGEIEPWRLKSDSEKGVYGLANAFLLSGVQHYIGTFWNIPDSAGLRFSVAFYQNLFNGLSIGESLRMARLHFVKTYGEENTAWMAYMLYGDPTFNYFGQKADMNIEKGHRREETDEGQEKESDDLVSVGIQKEKSRAGRGIFRPNSVESENAWQFVSRIGSNLQVVITLLVLLFLLVGTVKVMRYLNHTSDSGNEAVSRMKQDEIDRLMRDVEERLKTRQKKEQTEHKDNWTSRPMTLAVFGCLSGDEMDPKDDTELRRRSDLMARHINTAIQNQSSIPLVDRRHLDEIFKEYKRSLSDFADRRQDLIIFARFLGARLILFTEFLDYKKGYNLDLTVIETETSLIKVRFSYPMNKKMEYAVAASEIVGNVVNEIGKLYPLQCIIIGRKNVDEVELNIGSRVGVRAGFIFNVIGRRGDPQEIGQLKVTMVEEDSAIATVIESKRPLKNGDRALYVRNPYI